VAREAAKAKVVGAFGGRGTGKTAWLRQQLGTEKALAIWDYKHDPRMSDWGQGFTDMGGFIRSLAAPQFVSRYMPARSDAKRSVEDQFSLFCRAVFQRGCMAAFVDELPAVTAANKAPTAWRECVNVGREYRTTGDKKIKWLSIYATAQRPSECDKSFISNLDVIHTGRLAFANDAAVMAKSLNVRPEAIMALPDLHFIEKSADKAASVAGILKFSKNISEPARKPKG